MSQTPIKVRFAPSPTGKLHLGNVRTAVINWLYTRNQGGIFLLRMDDTDAERSTVEFEEGIKKDLTWLGLTWDEFAQQSHRLDRYDIAIEKLKADGRLYACYETPDELGLMRKSLLNRGLPPIYDRGSLKLSKEQIAKYEADGRSPHWRFKLLDGEIAWQDMVRGDVSFEAKNLSDPVLIREDGRPLYTISSVVDDIELGVTDIIRGEDHVANTATQVQLFEALGGDIPKFAHMPLVTDATGEKLSKRIGGLAVEQMRDTEQLDPLSINIFLAKLGTPDGALPLRTLDALATEFNISRYGRNAPKMDVRELEILNAKLMLNFEFDDVKDRLPDFDGANWEAVRGNISKLHEAMEWQDVISGDVQPMIDADDADFIASAGAYLPKGDLNEESWVAWTNALKEGTGRKGKGLFMPLRKALTGQERGPEMAVVFPLIGRERALQRLSAG